MLDLTASNTGVEWEQTDDRIRDLDQALRVRPLPFNTSVILPRETWTETVGKRERGRERETRGVQKRAARKRDV